ncbi:MAG: FapA family protein [Spirochaetaceae bacterium]|jgi:uncharacterized protein (DUF342 family)|nr:FapA family protein [Spirochaetaceae bacterium]
MIDFAALQQAVKEKLDEDRAIQLVEAEGANLEFAIAEASTLLGVPIRNLEYEIVIQKQSFFGIGENVCKIRAFERPELKKVRMELELEAEDLEEFGELELLDDRDGDVFVQRRHDGVYVKVTAPLGEGKKATIADIQDVLKRYVIVNYKDELIKQAIKAAKGQYVRIADYQNNLANDTSFSVDITEDEMRAFISVNPPGPGGVDLTFEEYMAGIKQRGVIDCISEEFLRDFADRPIYKQRICVATGRKAIDGIDSYLEYYFETDQSKIRIVADEKTGQVNLKELNLIQNVSKDEKLAKKNEADPGVNGCTVTGKMLIARSGKDVAVQLGKNVHFAEDGQTILADINGQVVFSNGKINVEMVYVVDGSVNLKTGNIKFLGNVVITGSVEEGFSVKAAGNIEVHGTVNKAHLTADGEIIINAGITGKDGVNVHAGGNIWAKFIENANVDCEDSVIVTDGIINSKIFASKKIICQGKRASIMGGTLRAGEEINAKQIGSPGGHTETVCEVGYDPKMKTRLDVLVEKKNAALAELDDCQLNLQTLANIKKQRGNLPEEKEIYHAELVERRDKATKTIEDAGNEINQINEAMQSIRMQGRVSATKIFPGVVIAIRDQRETTRTEFKATSFVLENNIIRASPYVDINTAGKKN